MSDVNSIKQLREKRYALARETRDLVDNSQDRCFRLFRKTSI
jgi:hypothetical protein